MGSKQGALKSSEAQGVISGGASALFDTMSVTGDDPDHSLGEYRYITFGISKRGRLLVVSHTEDGETIRIISAREARKGERKIYEEG